MTITLDKLKAAFKKSEPREGNSRPNNYYPFWDMKVGEQAVIRFLPDKNSDNPLGFMVEKLTHTLTINGENKTVPCLKMYGDDCPICKLSAAYYKEGDKANGKKYWRKKQHIAQALIVEDPLPPDATTGENHAGKVRFIALGYQIFEVIKEAFEGGELDDVPCSFDGGYNFIIKKSQQGEYSTYAVGSRFRSKASALTEDEIEFAQEHMVDLSSLLPQKPAIEKVESMLQSMLTGEAYSDGNESGSGDDGAEAPPARVSRPAPVAAKKPAAVEEDAPFDSDDEPAAPAAPAAEVDDEADRILAQIRARRANKA